MGPLLFKAPLRADYWYGPFALTATPNVTALTLSERYEEMKNWKKLEKSYFLICDILKNKEEVPKRKRIQHRSRFQKYKDLNFNGKNKTKEKNPAGKKIVKTDVNNEEKIKKNILI